MILFVWINQLVRPNDDFLLPLPFLDSKWHCFHDNLCAMTCFDSRFLFNTYALVLKNETVFKSKTDSCRVSLLNNDDQNEDNWLQKIYRESFFVRVISYLPDSPLIDWILFLSLNRFRTSFNTTTALHSERLSFDGLREPLKAILESESRTSLRVGGTDSPSMPSFIETGKSICGQPFVIYR